ncbi:DUF6455 family protein [Primorskyibacter sp. 2E107]|uniref:DUF6455 family protein n=1 Tax=Primorskyibacter sp. 2E107 TaxID=3403458 RepID=UPI003AF75A75
MRPLRDQADARPVRPLGATRAHYWMVQRMAKATGVDLVQAAERAALSQDDWARMVTRCRGCEWVQGCSHWLEQGTDALRPCPDGCANQGVFARLACEEEA